MKEMAIGELGCMHPVIINTSIEWSIRCCAGMPILAEAGGS